MSDSKDDLYKRLWYELDNQEEKHFGFEIKHIDINDFLEKTGKSDIIISYSEHLYYEKNVHKNSFIQFILYKEFDAIYANISFIIEGDITSKLEYSIPKNSIRKLANHVHSKKLRIVNIRDRYIFCKGEMFE